MSEADETTVPTATASPNGARRPCVVPPGEGLLEHAIRCLVDPEADCEVPQHEPCVLRQPLNYLATVVGLELVATLRQWPGGAQRLEEMMSRWLADPAASAASLQELISRPIPDSAATDDRPWPGHYL